MKCTPRGPDSELEMHCLLRVSAKASGPQRKTPILVLWGKKGKIKEFQAFGLQSTWGNFLLIFGSRAGTPPTHTHSCSFVLPTNPVREWLSPVCGDSYGRQLTSLGNHIQVEFVEISATEKTVANL